MNYLSDDENDNDVNVEPTFDELYPEEELDEETMALIRKHAIEKEDEEYTFTSKKAEPKPKKEKQNQKKVVKTLEDYIKEEEAKKPKKWSSTRADNKKKIIESVKSEKRHFNPRLPPFRTLEKKKNVENKVNVTEDSFPSLIKIKLNK